MLRISESIVRTINKSLENQKKPRHFGIDEEMYPSEIHMLMNIGDNPGVHMAKLARIAGVTRGAVSQLVVKLEKKGLVQKEEDPENSLKTRLRMTSKGKVAYYAHEQHHEELNQEMFEFINKLSDRDLEVIENFMNNLEKMANKLA